jgi:hypothetical protein
VGAEPRSCGDLSTGKKLECAQDLWCAERKDHAVLSPRIVLSLLAGRCSLGPCRAEPKNGVVNWAQRWHMLSDCRSCHGAPVRAEPGDTCGPPAVQGNSGED